MCGIFGLLAADTANITAGLVEHELALLFKLSESRGKEAAGVAIQTPEKIHVYKEAIPASSFIKSAPYAKFLKNVFKDFSQKSGDNLTSPFAAIGHSRLVTNGSQGINQNNQPVVDERGILIHNGIITNDKRLWEKYPQLQRQTDVDSEVLLKLLAHRIEQTGDVTDAVRSTFHEIEGSASIGCLLNGMDQLLLATNCGSLYRLHDNAKKCLVFTSEKYILEKYLRESSLGLKGAIERLHPYEALLFHLKTADQLHFPLSSEAQPEPIRYKNIPPPKPVTDLLEERQQRVSSLRRCKKCLLPETMPFIHFDSSGVCNHCLNHEPYQYKGETSLRELADRFKKNSREPDCIVCFSGGRDSSYGLHYVKNVLGMNPLTYTYDWGMVTDVARRNISRLCGRMGVENILVSADIKQKRRNIRNNIEAWMKKPSLGMIPLFMAGDKQYFYYADQIRKQNHLDLVFLFGNPLERTSFKSGFAGVNEKSRRIYNVPVSSKLKLVSYYLGEFVSNPSYLNSSIFDTAQAYYSSYMMKHDFTWLFHYIPWKEDEINQTLKEQFDWETATDTSSTWRIGDGTSAFYNFVYQTVAGFSEHDTFRSNQIREGLLTREEAENRLSRDKIIRWEAIEEYCRTIHIDFSDVIRTVYSMKPLY